MITKLVTQDQYDRAAKMADFGELNNSITKGKANLEGMIGEVVVADYMRELGYDVVTKSTKDYDMIINRFTVDVKTKRTNIPPLPNYECDIAETSRHQGCKYYIFTRILYDMSTVYILGYMPVNEFFRKAKFMKKGEVTDGFTIKANCYRVEVKELHHFTSKKV